MNINIILNVFLRNKVILLIELLLLLISYYTLPLALVIILPLVFIVIMYYHTFGLVEHFYHEPQARENE